MKRVLSKKDEQFILDNYLKLSSREISKSLGHPRGTICSFLKRSKLAIPAEVKQLFKSKALQGKYGSKIHPEDELIKEFYLLMPQKTLAELIGRSDSFLYGRMFRLGLTIPEEVKREFIEYSRIKPGSVPPNKGKKQSEYMSREAIAKTLSTRFTKGQKSHTELFDGAITIRWIHPERKGSQPHWYIRLSKGVWQELQIFEWERLNGPVPEGYVLSCQDGDTLNVDPSNWKLLAKADNMRRNSASLRLTDEYVAYTLATKNHPELVKEFIKEPQLIEMKRQVLLFNRQIKNHEKVSIHKTT